MVLQLAEVTAAYDLNLYLEREQHDHIASEDPPISHKCRKIIW